MSRERPTRHPKSGDTGERITLVVDPAGLIGILPIQLGPVQPPTGAGEGALIQQFTQRASTALRPLLLGSRAKGSLDIRGIAMR